MESRGELHNPVRCAGCGDWGILNGVKRAVSCPCGHETPMDEAQLGFWKAPPPELQKDVVA